MLVRESPVLWRPENGVFPLPGEDLPLLYAQDKTWRHTLLVCRRSAHLLSSEKKGIEIRSFSLSEPLDGSEKVLGTVGENGNFHVLALKSGQERCDYWSPNLQKLYSRRDPSPRVGSALSISSSFGQWNQRTPTGSRQITPERARTFWGNAIALPRREPPSPPSDIYEGAMMALENASIEGGVNIWVQREVGGPINWWWFNFDLAKAIPQGELWVSAGERLHDAHPTLTGILVRTPSGTWKSWTPSHMWRDWAQGRSVAYSWRRLSPHPQDIPKWQAGDWKLFGLVEEAWGRRIQIETNTPICRYSDWRPGLAINVSAESKPGEIRLALQG